MDGSCNQHEANRDSAQGLGQKIVFLMQIRYHRDTFSSKLGFGRRQGNFMSFRKISIIPLSFYFLIAAPCNIHLIWAKTPKSKSNSEKSATEILKKLDNVWFEDSSYAYMKMDIQKEKYLRTLELKNWAKGHDKAAVVIIAPPKERGIATLKSGDEITNYLPKTDQTIQIGPSLRGDFWMGSHFSNDDILRSSRFSRDFDGIIEKESKLKGDKVALLNLKPKAGVATPWSRVKVEFNTSKNIPLKQEFFDAKDKLKRTIVFESVKKMDGRLIPTKITLTPAQSKNKEYTTLTYLELKRKVDLADSFFTLTQIKTLESTGLSH